MTIITGGGGGITSEFWPDNNGNDDQYGSLFILFCHILSIVFRIEVGRSCPPKIVSVWRSTKTTRPAAWQHHSCGHLWKQSPKMCSIDFVKIYQPFHTFWLWFTHVVEQLCCLDHLTGRMGKISYIDIQSPYQFCGLSVISVIKHDQTKVLLMQPSGRIKWRFRWPWVSVQCFRTYGGGWRSIWKIGSDGALYI